MHNQTIAVHTVRQASPRPAFVDVFCQDQGGCIRLSVSAHSAVEYLPAFIPQRGIYALLVWMDDELVGWHYGERTRRIVTFSRESDAMRLADVRNALWQSPCLEEVV